MKYDVYVGKVSVEAVFNRLGGEEGAEKLLRGELDLVVVDPFHETGELTIQIPALRRPTLAELQAKYSWVRQIERDDSPEGLVTIRLGTLLRKGEDLVEGREYERRRKTIAGQMLGFQHAEWLFEHRDSFPGLTVLLGKFYIDFPGVVAVDADGCRLFPYLRRDDERCFLDWRWSGGDLGRFDRLAVGK